MMEVIFAVVFLLQIWKVPVELGRAFHDRVCSISQPIFVAGEQISLIKQIPDLCRVTENVRAVPEDAGILCWDDIMAVIPVAVTLKVPAGIVTVLRFRPPLEPR